VHIPETKLDLPAEGMVLALVCDVLLGVMAQERHDTVGERQVTAVAERRLIGSA